MPAFKNKFQPSAQTAQALAQYGKELADKMAV
jgi:hypothetical protein